MAGRGAGTGTPDGFYPVDLSGLDAVRWAELTHAYGPAADVPDCIRGLASRDPRQRGDAIGSLFGTIWHQGTVYAATAPAVSFLVRVACAAGVPDRDQVLDLLAAVSGGLGYVQVHRRLLEHGDFDAGDLDAREWAERGWVADAHDAVLAAAPQLAGLLWDQDARVRAAAAYTLAGLPEREQLISARLTARFRAEDDAPAAASCVLALAVLARRAGRQDQVTDALRLAARREGVVRLAGAVACRLPCPRCPRGGGVACWRGDQPLAMRIAPAVAAVNVGRIFEIR
jgi:hypothetical protein